MKYLKIILNVGAGRPYFPFSAILLVPHYFLQNPDQALSMTRNRVQSFELPCRASTVILPQKMFFIAMYRIPETVTSIVCSHECNLHYW